MKQEQFNRILPCYIGQECLADKNQFTLKGVTQTSEGTLAYDGSEINHIPQGWWIENCDFKLLLRPLSDMKEEEADMFKELVPDVEEISFMDSVIYMAKIVNALRAASFDADNLIPAGFALDKTKTT